MLGGALCVLAGVLCLVSVSWSAAATVLVYNDPFVVEALKRDVGSSIYIGWASGVLLLLGGAALLVISMPQMPRNPWETCMDAEPDTILD